jgi:hypothetical protein
LAAHPVVGDALCGLGDALLEDLADRPRELVALRVSAVLDSVYVWTGHTHLALDSVLSRSEIAAVACGPAALAGRDTAVLRAVDELLADDRLARLTYFTLGSEAFGVIVATGFYRTLAAVARDLDPRPDIRPIAGLETPARARETHAGLAS